MPLRPTDFTLSATQLADAQAVLTAWDARDPWTIDRPLEERLQRTLEASVAPRLVITLSPVHAARFLRDIVEHTLVDHTRSRGRLH